MLADRPKQSLVITEATDDGDSSKLRLHEERFHVGKRLRKTLVRIVRTTLERFVAVDEAVEREDVVVRRVPIGREVDAIPPIREEGGVTIMPVVKEELVLVRRLILTEEVHVQRIRTTERHIETVALRRQEVIVTRTEVGDTKRSVLTEQTPE